MVDDVPRRPRLLPAVRRFYADSLEAFTGGDETRPREAEADRHHPHGQRPHRRPRRRLHVHGEDGHDVSAVIGDCAAYENGARRPGPLRLGEAGEIARTTDGFVWVGLQQANVGDVKALAREFDLPDLAVEDAVLAHQRPKLDTYDDMVFVVLKPVRYIDAEETVDVAELAIFIGPGFAVTVRHGESDVLRRVRGELDHPSAPGNDPHRGSRVVHGPTGVLYRALDLTVDDYEAALAHIEVDVDEIEAAVFAPQGSDHTERIYKLKREIADFRRAVVPLVPVLQRLSEGDVAGLDPQATPYFSDVLDHALRAAEAIENQDRTLTDVLQADLARAAARQSAISARQAEIAVRQNEDMRKISAWAAIGLVPTGIAGIYGMNFEHMPELDWTYGYPMAMAVMVGACAGLYGVFRRNGWL